MEDILVICGLSYKTAPVEIRERFWFDEARQAAALQSLSQSKGIEGIVLLSTCNRTEFVIWASSGYAALKSIRHYLEKEFGLSSEDWTAFYQYVGEEALAHLFRVTAGLDSMVMGEPEIAGQVKTAWARAQAAGTASRGLDRVFQKALNVTKRVRTETAIGNAAVSVPYAAVELAKQIFGALNGRKVMILGAGKMGELSARYLKASGASRIYVTNRTHETAVTLAKSLGGTAIPFEERWNSLAEADIVICSTGSPQTILSKHDAERIRQQRGGRPVFLIDIAVPRDVDPAVREVSGVFLYDIDDLQQVVNQNLEQRKAAGAEAEIILLREAHDFQQKLGAERVVPTLVALHDRLTEIRRQELRNFSAEHSHLPQAEMDEVEALTERIIQRIGNQMARELKQIQHVPEQEQLTDALRRLFQLHSAAPISSVRG